ncbi:hypothetical protein IQ255_25840 [Pleurocapsales cyanobacterium LEGE 10410]|nr:hypothetical protein [Pleurocapsales cyanobacterium LEGE 10410]
MKPIVNKLLLSIAVNTLMFTSNFNSLNSSNTQIEAELDIYQDSLQAIQKIIELVKNIGNNHQKTEPKEPKESVEPISFQEFMKYLPDPPPGWDAQEPKGNTTSFGDYRVSQVKQTYINDNKKITISIFDWAFNSALYTPFLLTTEFSQESTEGYNRGIKIGDIPGREEYTYAEQDGSLNLLVNSRFLVQIEGSNIENAELRDWWELIDEGALTKINSE